MLRITVTSEWRGGGVLQCVWYLEIDQRGQDLHIYVIGNLSALIVIST
jgi:hypothetical protein